MQHLNSNEEWCKSWSKEHQNPYLFIPASGCRYVGWNSSLFSSLGVLGAVDSHCNAVACLSTSVQQLHPPFCDRSVLAANIFNVTCFTVIGWFGKKKSPVYQWIVGSHGSCYNRAPLECGGTGGWHYGCPREKFPVSRKCMMAWHQCRQTCWGFFQHHLTISRLWDTKLFCSLNSEISISNSLNLIFSLRKIGVKTTYNSGEANNVSVVKLLSEGRNNKNFSCQNINHVVMNHRKIKHFPSTV